MTWANVISVLGLAMMVISWPLMMYQGTIAFTTFLVGSILTVGGLLYEDGEER